MLASWKESYDKPRQCVKKQRYHFANKSLYSQSYGFSSSQVWISFKEGWASKNWCFQIVVLEKILDKMVRWHHWLSLDMSLSRLQERVGDRGAWCAAVHGVTESWARLSNWTMTTWGVGHGPALQLDLGLVKPILELWPPSCKIICISLSHGVCGNWLELQ